MSVRHFTSPTSPHPEGNKGRNLATCDNHMLGTAMTLAGMIGETKQESATTAHDPEALATCTIRCTAMGGAEGLMPRPILRWAELCRAGDSAT